jgi:hypothetical protein
MVELAHSTSDPTLAALDAVIEAASSEAPRPYLGASQIGEPCSRKLWYGFRWVLRRAISASGLRRINDGHRGEQVLIEMLRQVPGVSLWTEDPAQPGEQIGFVLLGGHFRGHLDGVIEGLYQASKTPHVWEAKVCNETKVRKLEKLKEEKGEKEALEAWDETYFAQAQIYMYALKLTRHYLTVATPGVRDIISCRTDYQPTKAKTYLQKARDVISANRPPLRISEDSGWYQCKRCDFHALCHGLKLPVVNCRTCAHATAHLDEAQPWTCDLHRRVIDIEEQRQGCLCHAFHPDLIRSCDAIGADKVTGAITYRCKDSGDTWVSGLQETSHDATA